MTPGRSRFSPKSTGLEDKYNKSLFSASKAYKGRKLLVLTVQMGQNRSEQIVIYEQDNPKEVSEEFCRRHQYDREFKDMLQYQIESTICEAKSKIMQKQRAHNSNYNIPDSELEIPLEVTYSDAGLRFSPRHEFSTIPNGTYDKTNDKIEHEEHNSGFFTGQKLNQEQSPENENQQQEYEHENGPDYPEFSRNIPESGKKYIEQQQDNKLNINTQELNNLKNSKTSMHNVAQKYLDNRNQFIPTITEKTAKVGIFRVGTIDPVYNRLITDAKGKQISKNIEKPAKSGKLSKSLHPDYVGGNHGERLYQRSRINKEKLSRKARKALKLKLQEELENETHTPKINDFTHKFEKRSYKIPIADCLTQVYDKTKYDKQIRVDAHEEIFRIEHPFVPVGNKMSHEIMSEKITQREASVHEQLSLSSNTKCHRFEKSTKKEDAKLVVLQK